VEPLAFEFTSRGDPVSGRLWLGPGPRISPLVLVAPAMGSCQRAPAVEALCAALARAGLAGAAIDLPLQGDRASSKLSARLAACGARKDEERTGAEQLLWGEFLRQAALDLAAAADVLARRDDLDGARLGCVGFEPGGEAAAAFAAGDARVRVLQRVAAAGPPDPIVRLLRERLTGAP